MISREILVNYTGKKGGGLLYSFEMTKALIDNGNSVSAIISYKAENINEWKNLKLKRLFIIETYSNKFTFIINTIKLILNKRAIINAFIDIKFDYVYVPMIQPWTNLINKNFPNVPVIVTIHDPIPHSSMGLIYRKIQNNAILKSNKCVVLSKKFINFVESKYNKKGNVFYLPHGIFDYYKSFSPVKSIYNKSSINFLFFGRINEYKGLDILLKAFNLLTQYFSNISLTIAGEGDISQYKPLIFKANVNVYNRWINDDEVCEFFNCNNLVTVLPYTDATQSGVIPLAMAYKSLIIATKVGGIDEQITHGNTGILIPPNDVNQLFIAMKETVEGKINFNEITNNAYIYINNHSWGKIADYLVQNHMEDKIIVSKKNI